MGLKRDMTLTLRERNKKDKFLRIRAASRKLFIENGFEPTTTRQIAQEADVGLSTLFLYATDKRDLLFLVFNDDLDALTTRAFADLDPSRGLLDSLEVALRHFFLFYGHDKVLSRDLTREITFYTTGMQSERFQATRKRTIDCISEVVRAARIKGEVATDASDLFVAKTIFYLLAAEIRMWLAEESDNPEDGLTEFMQRLKLLVFGLGGRDTRTL
ncbi:TetR/AcrR family transcriptional regulator [Pseudomonas prosekii]|uniref:TetR/AcrR family transcriptional regulator n=1 Tax=Pseudomonas prosekii TaxID=1148509 RepID=UPI0011EA8FDA|nr:helix-turn-helix domain-containing protein [Pseudomonas prosekii]